MQNKSVAIFIDAENIAAKFAKDIFNFASHHGEIIVKRIYADWTSSIVKGWREKIAQHSITAIQNFKLNNNKNSSDMHLMADAMSIFYEKDIDIFIIVSSDSDYTPLVQKLRENKKQVVGMGENKTNKFYVNVFSDFHYLGGSKEENEKDDEFTQELFKIINELIEKKNRALYSQIQQKLKEKYPDFNAKNYDDCKGRSAFKKFINKFTRGKYQEKHDGYTFYLIKS